MFFDNKIFLKKKKLLLLLLLLLLLAYDNLRSQCLSFFRRRKEERPWEEALAQVYHCATSLFV